MINLIKLAEDKYKLYELDSRTGLNGSKCLESFPCMMDEEHNNFYVWLGDITIDKLTKTTFLNIVSFAEKAGASALILIQNRNHAQKCKSSQSLIHT